MPGSYLGPGMNASSLLQALHAGRRVYGTLIVSDSPRWPATVAKIGLDFVFIDTEHIALDRGILSWMCQTYAALGLAPIVRIPSPDPYQACMALDGGAAGIVAPYVETVEQVQALRGAVKLRPIKGRKLADVLAGREVEPVLAEYQARACAENILVINIESQAAIENLDALLSVEGVDVALIGPHDLSCNLGVPEDYGNPRFDEAVRTIFRTARKHGVAAGIHSWMGVEREISWMEDGLNFLIHSADIIAMRELLAGDLARIRKAMGDQGATTQASVDNI